MSYLYQLSGGVGDGFQARIQDCPNVLYYNIPQKEEEEPVCTTISPIWGRDWSRTQRYAFYAKIADVVIYKPQNIGTESE